MSNILNAIAALHEDNLIHGNLKLSNILLDSNFNIKLTDYGFYKIQ